MSEEADALLELRGITKSFDGTRVLKGIDLSVRPGEFLTLLGPSGCGKTTTLRLIAGLDSPDAGSVWLEGRDITALPPEKRAVNTVFQNYALFPHMNVAQNIGYGLKLRGVKKAEIAQRVTEMLALVQLEGYEKRMPAQLSGGQRQRVAIARSVVVAPRMLLLDEPLGALDLQLRRQMQTELKSLQQRLGIAFIYITHDQEEALNMSDRIAVMREGEILQLGSPADIYERPQSVFAAQFIGQSNLLKGVIAARLPDNMCALDIGGLTVPVQSNGTPPAIGTRATLCLRTERVHFGRDGKHEVHLSGVVKERQYLGGTQRTVLELPDGEKLTTVSQSQDDVQLGERVFVWWNPAKAALIPEEAGANE